MEVYFTANSACFSLANVDFFTPFCVSDGAEMSSAGWALGLGWLVVHGAPRTHTKFHPWQTLLAMTQKANRGLPRTPSQTGWPSPPRGSTPMAVITVVT